MKAVFNPIVISGCSGGGKSTLIEELARRGFQTAEEPGRRIVREETARGGDALPWKDFKAFLARAIELALQDFAEAAERGGVTFFDRSLIDAVSGLAHVTGQNVREAMVGACSYAPKVFMAPPWPELFVSDEERQHDFKAAEQEYQRLLQDYRQLGYDLCLLPKESVDFRADYVLRMTGLPETP